MLTDPVMGDNGPAAAQGMDPRQQIMLALMQQRRQQPQGGGWAGGLNQAAQNFLQMYGMKNGFGMGGRPQATTGPSPAAVPFDQAQSLSYLRPNG